MDAGTVVAGCRRRGLLPFANFNRVHLVPPLTTTPAEVEEAVGILDEALTEAFRAASTQG